MLTGKMGKELEEVAAKAEQAQKDKESGVKTRGIQQTVRFDSRINNTNISCYVNGRFVGTTLPMGDLFNVWVGDQPAKTTLLSARSTDGAPGPPS